MQRILQADIWYKLHSYRPTRHIQPIGIQLITDLINQQSSLYIPFGKQFIITLVDHNIREQFPLRWHVRDVNDIDYFNRILSTQTVLLTGIHWVYSELFYNDQGFY